MEKAISEKIVAYFHSFKMSLRSPKPTSFDLPNVLNKYLSKNPTLTRRCEVYKFKTRHKKTLASFRDFEFLSPKFLVSYFLSSFFLIF